MITKPTKECLARAYNAFHDSYRGEEIAKDNRIRAFIASLEAVLYELAEFREVIKDNANDTRKT